MPQPPNEEIIDALQGSVRLHLTAIENYTAQAAHFGRWGYAKLAERYKADAKEERGHLKLVQDRLEYYDVQPVYDHDEPDWPRHDYEGILAANYVLEVGAADHEKKSILVCRAAGDEQSALVFSELLAGSDASVGEIESDQKVIEQIGLENFLANMTGG